MDSRNGKDETVKMRLSAGARRQWVPLLLRILVDRVIRTVSGGYMMLSNAMMCEGATWLDFWMRKRTLASTFP